MKKLLYIIPLILLLALLAACGAPEHPSDADQSCLGQSELMTYDSIIAMYRNVVEICPDYESRDEYGLEFSNEETEALFDKLLVSTLAFYPREILCSAIDIYTAFGYAVKDVNKDGTDELILFAGDEIVAVFTEVNGEPILLEHFWNRKTGWIDPDGLLHVGGSNGADNSVSKIYRIESKTGELVLLEEGGTDGYDEANNSVLYYKTVGGEKKYISEEEHSEWEKSLPYAELEKHERNYHLGFEFLFDSKNPAPEISRPEVLG